MDYDVHNHVSSDVAIGQPFLPQSTFKTRLAMMANFERSERNMLVLNQEKSNYMVIRRAEVGTTWHRVVGL